jgi:histidine ammonia-lyase
MTSVHVVEGASTEPRTLVLSGNGLTLPVLREVWSTPIRVTATRDALERAARAHAVVLRVADSDAPVYGVNTGFGMLARTTIPPAERRMLQRKIVVSHAAGVGDPLPDGVVRLILCLKLSSLLQGHSGVGSEVLEALRQLLAADALPEVPSQGSVGASGDLAPLAHLVLPLLGLGHVRIQGERLTGAAALARLGLHALELGPKEGLALLNGTQVSTAIALAALFELEDAFAAALVTGALSTDALKGSDLPFDARVQRLRGHDGQADVALVLRGLLAGSAIRSSHRDCDRVQDPYSVRCQPQVMGACLDFIRMAGATLEVEANAVTDNPLVFADTGEIISGGNFHAEPVAFAADQLAIAACEIGSLAERRIALLVDPAMSAGLPPFLAPHAGTNSGFMIAQVTAAALVAENRMLAHPASLDSIPTSANQEDHVSMATHGARRVLTQAANLRQIIGIEFLAAGQAIDLRRPLTTSPALAGALAALRRRVPFAEQDRLLADDIAAATELLTSSEVGGRAHAVPGSAIRAAPPDRRAERGADS